MHLADEMESLVSERIWSESRHIEQKLNDLTEYVETVIQKYLRNEFATIADYNEQAGELAEPLRIIVFADFPEGLTDAGSKRFNLARVVACTFCCFVIQLSRFLN